MEFRANTRIAGPAHIVLLAGLIGLGLLTCWFHDFALIYQPIPASIPAHDALAYLSGLILIVVPPATLSVRFSVRAVAILCVYLVLFWLLPQLVQVAGGITQFGRYIGLAEVTSVVAGVTTLYLMFKTSDRLSPQSLRGVFLARRVFGVACLIFGWSHFEYAAFTSTMVPNWMPDQYDLALLTGCIHGVCGFCLLFNVWPRIAAGAEAAMMTSFVLLVHIPSVGASPPLDWAPDLRGELVPLCWATVLSCSAWLMFRAAPKRVVRGV